jgi:hypothetical protein
VDHLFDLRPNNTMTKPQIPALYVDAEGVERGHYVYAHAEKSSGRIFYVGKGQKSRAWDSGRRSQAWKDYVASLTEGHVVLLLKTDLSEIEAFEEERLAIAAHGGHAAEGGTLINWVPGGEAPASIELSLGPGWTFAETESEYHRVRKFASPSREEQSSFLKSFWATAVPLRDEIDALIAEADSGERIEDSNAASSLRGIVDNVCDAVSDRLSKRISWKTFCEQVDFELDQLELFGRDERPAFLRSIFARTDNAIRQWFAKVDSGNKKDAELAETRDWIAKQHGGDLEAALKWLREMTASLNKELPKDSAPSENGT